MKRRLPEKVEVFECLLLWCEDTVLASVCVLVPLKETIKPLSDMKAALTKTLFPTEEMKVKRKNTEKLKSKYLFPPFLEKVN